MGGRGAGSGRGSFTGKPGNRRITIPTANKNEGRLEALDRAIRELNETYAPIHKSAKALLQKMKRDNAPWSDIATVQKIYRDSRPIKTYNDRRLLNG